MSRIPTAGPHWGQVVQTSSADFKFDPGYVAPQRMQLSSVMKLPIGLSLIRMYLTVDREARAALDSYNHNHDDTTSTTKNY